MQFEVLQDCVAETYNNLSHFLEILFYFNSVTSSQVMLKLVVLASTKLPTIKSPSPFVMGSNYLFH